MCVCACVRACVRACARVRVEHVCGALMHACAGGGRARVCVRPVCVRVLVPALLVCFRRVQVQREALENDTRMM